MELPKLKVCGITRHEDGEAALSIGSSYLGFILYEGSPRFIKPANASSLWGELMQVGACSVAVEVDPSTDRLKEIRQIGFDFFQLHFPCSSSPEKVSAWAEIVGPEKLWLAPRISPKDNFPSSLLPFSETFLVDAFSESKFGGTGLTSDWERFSEWKGSYPSKKWVLAGGLGPENLGSVLECAKPDVVDVNSSVEIEPGNKDHFKLKELLPFFKSTD